MAVTSPTLYAPGNNFASPHPRPQGIVRWTGGVGPINVTHQWDTVNTFDSVDLITDVNTSVSSPDIGVPPSDMSAGTWYYRAQVTDTNDADTQTSNTHTFQVIDPQDRLQFQYINLNVGANFEAGVDGDPDDLDRFLYVNSNVLTGVPVPFIDSIAPSLISQGGTLIIYGRGFDNAARDWGCVARLYDSPELDGSYVSLPEVAYVDSSATGDQDILTVTVPGGSSSGWVVVANDSGAP